MLHISDDENFVPLKQMCNKVNTLHYFLLKNIFPFIILKTLEEKLLSSILIILMYIILIYNICLRQ